MSMLTIAISAGCGVFIFLLIVIYLIAKKKMKKDTWESSQYMKVSKFNKLHKNQLDTSKIKINTSGDGPLFKSKAHCGFLLASGKVRKIPKFPLLPDRHFKPSKYGTEEHIKAYLLPNAHQLVFGGTGSGKTDTLLIPNILLNAVSKERPSGLVFDPKGEIYMKTAPLLLAQGYKVININLTSSANSDRWSPFQFAIDSGIEYVKYSFIASLLVEKGRIWDEITSMQNTRNSDAKTSLNETAEILVKLSDEEKSVWTSSAIDLLSTACISLYSYLTTKAYNEIKKIEKYKNIEISSKNFNEVKEKIFKDEELTNIIFEHLKNLSIKNITNTIATTPIKEWTKFVWAQGWFDKLGTFNATQDQLKSFQMNISSALSFLGGEDFEDFVSESDFSYNDLISKNTIIFINIPSSAEKRKAIATLMVQQIWAFLGLKSQSYKGGKLPIPFYFYFEELANIPKIPCFENILTLGRGMKIFAFVVVQSIQQFEKIYGQNTTSIVWDNTMSHVYLLGQDNTVREFIAKQYGEKEYSKKDGTTVTKTLIDTEKLGTIKQGECVVMEQRQMPIWLNTASYENYKIFHEWERKVLLDYETKKGLLDKGTKIKNQTKDDLEDKKNILLQKFTKKSSIKVLPNIIQEFNQQNELNYCLLLFKSLINSIFWSKEDSELYEIKTYLLSNAIDRYKILSSETTNEDIEICSCDNSEIDNNGVCLECNKSTFNLGKDIELSIKIIRTMFDDIYDILDNYWNEQEKVKENQRNKYKFNINQDQTYSKKFTIGKTVIDYLLKYCAELKTKLPTFIYDAHLSNDYKLPTYNELINLMSIAILQRRKEIITIWNEYWLKNDIIKIYIEPVLESQAESDKEMINVIEKIDEKQNIDENVKFESIVDEIKKTSVDNITEVVNVININKTLDERIKLQQYEMTNYVNEFNGDLFDLYKQTRIQMYQRIIIQFLLEKYKDNKLKLDDFICKNNSWIKKFPLNLRDKIEFFNFDIRLLDAIKKTNRKYETYLLSARKKQNIDFKILEKKFAGESIEDMNQDEYFTKYIVEWLESI